MKLSQLLHKVTPDQLLIVVDQLTEQPKTILARGNRTSIPKDSPLNSATVCTIYYVQAYMVVSVIQHN